ncbi:MAG: hypothetical protein K0S09_1914 [Sphingobacteriaceae bacterium]|jgi:hypothetical protein|nr:hypothetical protein [Sphingobacteriaceae bacterium]
MEHLPLTRKSKTEKFDAVLRRSGYGEFIPSNTIINKRFPNFGATHSEISCHRHSIVILPFITIVEVKKEDFKEKVCAVTSSASEDDIVDYLQNTKGWQKLLVVPEGFPKLIRALRKFDPYYRENYFVLYDEFDRIIHNALFRKEFVRCLKEVLMFTNKAMVSATAVELDFEEFSDFRRLDVSPDYTDYKVDLNVVVTNNVRTSARNLLNYCNGEGPRLIFTNCTKTIEYLSQLDFIKDDYTIFCSEDLDRKYFALNDIKCVKNSIADQKYSKFNFFTSRFYTGVDILIDGPSPDVFMITNVPKAFQSIIDPRCDALQIYGRSRNGVNSFTHITSLTYSSENKNESFIMSKFQHERITLETWKNTMLTLGDSGEQEEIEGLIKKSYSSPVVDDDPFVRPYYREHIIQQRKLRYFYESAKNLKNGYSKMDQFNLTFDTVIQRWSDLDKEHSFRLSAEVKRKSYAQLLDLALFKMVRPGTSMTQQELNRVIDIVRKDEPLTFECYRLFGLEYLKQLKFSQPKMRDALFRHKKTDKHQLILMLDRIISEFQIGNHYYCDDISKKLKAIYEEYQYESAPGVIKTAVATDIERYFECVRRNSKQKIDGIYKSYYIINKPKYKISDDLSFLSKDKGNN